MRKSLLRGGLILSAAALFLLPGPQGWAAPADETLTGCLQKAGNGFSLLAEGERLTITGDLDFAKHAGHTVKVTGEESRESFRATALEHVSPQCDGSAQRSATKAEGANHLDASDQGTSEADRESTAKIRRAIVDDDSLSTYAHNVTIITRDGKVSLRGEVPSAKEKAAVAAKASAAHGSAVDNRLTVKPDSN